MTAPDPARAAPAIGAGPIVLVVNPVATRSRRGLAEEAARALGPLGLVDVVQTARAGDGEGIARRAAERGARLVVTVGGDGTVNEVAAALAGGDVALAPLPAGSTNVFVRALGWPARGDAALARLVARLEEGASPEPVALGQVTAGEVARPFTVSAGVGLDAETVAIVEEHPALKRRLRHLGFAVATVAGHRRARHESPIEVVVDAAAPLRSRALVVACGGPYAYVGSRPLDLVPGPRHEGGLGWLAVGDLRALRVVAIVTGAALGARHVGAPGVVHGTGARSIAVTCPEPIALQADGEALGRHREITLAEGPRLMVLRP